MYMYARIFAFSLTPLPCAVFPKRSSAKAMDDDGLDPWEKRRKRTHIAHDGGRGFGTTSEKETDRPKDDDDDDDDDSQPSLLGFPTPKNKRKRRHQRRHPHPFFYPGIHHVCCLPSSRIASWVSRARARTPTIP